MLLVAKSTAAAQSLTMTAGLKFSPPTYRTHCWQPIHLEFMNRGPDAIEGSAVLTLTDEQAPARITLPASAPPHARVRATMWAYFPTPSTSPTRRGSVPPLGIVEFRGRDGALLTRAEIVGLPISDTSTDAAADEDLRGELILVVGRRELLHDEPYEATWVIHHVGDATGIPMAVANVGLDRFPHESAGLRSLKAIVLEAIDPDSLDRTQRTALLSYLHGGGVVVVAAPVDSVGRTGSWLEPHLPVRLIGSRMASQVETSPDGGDPPLKLREWLPIVEAVDAGGDVLLRSRDYVHVATKSMGLGKVVFTSFPINGLAENQPRASVLWQELLDLNRPGWEWRQTQLDAMRHDVLGAMLGQKVAPWTIAAAIVGGYLVLVLATQGLFRGPSRPKAFAASTLLALGFAGVLLITGMTRNRDTSLQSARLTVLDVSPAGGGWRHESVAFVGVDDPKMSLRSTGENVFARPALADGANPPTVAEQPFVAPGAGVFPQRIERVWEASGPADLAHSLRAIASLSESGLSLEIDNRMGQPLRSPLLVLHGRALAMDDVPDGASTVTAFRANALGDFTSGGVLTSDEAKRRGRIVTASLKPAKGVMVRPEPGDEVPMLVGWLDDGGTPLLGPADRDVQGGKVLVMVRTPVQIAPQKAGARVSIPAVMMKLDTGRLPYERDRGESVATPQPGQWLIGFAAPAEVGRLRPTRATLRLRITLPGHRFAVYKGQCADGTPKANQFSEPLVAWERDVGAREVSMNLEPRDVDADGRVWLLVDVSPIGASAEPLSWQVKDIELTMDAEITGPAAPIALGPATTKPTESRDDWEAK